MKNLLFVLLIAVSVNGSCQESSRTDLYYKTVQQFYAGLMREELTISEVYDLFGEYALELEEYFFLKSCGNINSNSLCEEELKKRINHPTEFSSLFFKELIKIKDLFLYEDDTTLMDSLISNSVLYDETSPSDIAIDVKLSNNKAIYFYLNKYADEAVYITNIYIENGESFYNHLFTTDENMPDSFLYRLAIINDPDGYTNVRKGTGTKYPIVGKFFIDEVFAFIPNSNNNWWKVKNKSGTIVGFMHKSKICPIGSLSEGKKESLYKSYNK